MDWVAATKSVGKFLAILAWIQAILLIPLGIIDYAKPNRTLEIVMIVIFIMSFLYLILAALLFKYVDRTLVNPIQVEGNAETTEEGRRSIREFCQNVRILRLAASQVFPPAKSFNNNCIIDDGDETTDQSIDDQCAICLEEFKNGDLVQPFPKCNHEFHASCINSWLLGGKVTCPICRFSLRDLFMVEVETTSRVVVNVV